MIWRVLDRTGGAFTVREQVDPEDELGLVALFQRRGLGTAVARELCNEARMAGVTRIVASATEGIPSSDAFPRSLGFEVFDEPSQYRSDNRVIHAGERPVHRAVLDLRE